MAWHNLRNHFAAFVSKMIDSCCVHPSHDKRRRVLPAVGDDVASESKRTPDGICPRNHCTNKQVSNCCNRFQAPNTVISCRREMWAGKLQVLPRQTV